MRGLIDHVPRGFLVLLSGGGVAHMVAVAALPLLGRLYDPATFGQLGGVMAVVSLATVVVHGRYHLAIPVVDDDAGSQALLFIAIASSALLSFPVASVILVLVNERPEGLSLGTVLLAATLLTMMSATLEILAYWRSRRGRFGSSARNSAARAMLTTVGQVGFSAFSAAGLIIGTALGLGGALGLALYDFLRHDAARVQVPSARVILQTANQYRHYPIFGMPQGWLASLSWNAMPLLLLRFGGAEVAGHYWVAYRLLMAPLALFNGTYRQSTLPLLRGRALMERRALAARHSLLIAGIGAVPLMPLFMFGEQVFALAMGPSWGPAGTIVGWLSIGVFADLFKVPTICLLQSQSHQNKLLLWEASIIFVRYAASLTFLHRGECVQAVAVFSGLGLVGWSLFTVRHLFWRTQSNKQSTST